MAASKSGLVRDGCSKLFKTFDTALKKSERHLVLSTTYGVNSSWSKKVIVGLRLRLDGKFEPVVRLINNYSSGVSLNAAAWTDLVDRFESIDKYFEGEDRRAPGKFDSLINDTVSLCDNCTMRFTSSHGSKVVAFYAPGGGQKDVESQEDSQEAGEPSAKKLKTYSPVILMQKVTYDGLKNIACCVSEHLLQLGVLVNDVDMCKDSIVRYFASIVTTRKMKSPTLQQIGAVVCEDADVAREVISLQSAEVFRDHYFDIVFYELTRLFLAYIIADILQSVLTDTHP